MSVTKLVGVVRVCLESRAARQAVTRSGAASSKYVATLRNDAFHDPRLDRYLRVATAAGVVVAGFGRELPRFKVWCDAVQYQYEHDHGSLRAFALAHKFPYSTLHGWLFGGRSPELSRARALTVALGHSLSAKVRDHGGARLDSFLGKKRRLDSITP